jgi:tetratricopeptide (TPR) repeat protein
MKDREEQYLEEGYRFFELGRFSDAVEYYDKAIAINPNNADAWLNRGYSLARLDRHAEAIAAFDRAIAINPNDANAWVNRGNSLCDNKLYTEALVSYDKAIGIKPDLLEALINRSKTLTELGRHAEANAAHDRVVAIDPDYEAIIDDRPPSKRVSLGRYEDAIQSWDKAIAINPNDVTLWTKRGDALRSLGKHKEAIASYDKAIAINPNDAEAWFNRGVALGELRRYEEAVGSYDKVIAINPNDGEAWFNRGNALCDNKLYTEALVSYDKAIGIKPDFAEALINRGLALTFLGRYSEALTSYDKAIGIKPDFAEVLVNHENAITNLDRYSEALVSWDKAIVINPNDADTWFYHGNALCDNKLYTEALASYDKAIAINPNDADVWKNRGDALKELKRYKEALSSYERGIQLDPDDELAIEEKWEIQNKINNETQQNIDNVDRKTLIRQPKVIRAFEYYAGSIRVKVSVKNPSLFTIHDVFLDIETDEKILLLEHHEPEYQLRKGKIELGNINPQNDRTVSLYLEPLICAKEGTDINCHVIYKDAEGKPGSIEMQPLRIQAVCPIFETKEPINVGMLKGLIEELPKTDTKILLVPRSINGNTIVTLCRGSLQSHDIQHISTLIRESVTELWYYGRTKVTLKDIVIKLGIVKDRDCVEITAWSNDSKDLTGLLAELSRNITEDLSKWGNVQKIFNVTIKDSIVQRTNLMSFCDAEGKCSGDVTIADSVVMGSNILSANHKNPEEISIPKTRVEDMKSKDSDINKNDNKITTPSPKRGDYAGVCPKCGSKLVWRVANKTGELYRGCDNFDGGCRYQERSY